MVEGVDYIIQCTGYLLNYPFMDQKIRLESKSQIVPDMLYKCLTLIDNNQCFYLGMQAMPFTYLMTDIQSFYICDIILGHITLPDKSSQQGWLASWKERQTTFKGFIDAACAQADYMAELVSECRYPMPWDAESSKKLFQDWLDMK